MRRGSSSFSCSAARSNSWPRESRSSILRSSKLAVSRLQASHTPFINRDHPEEGRSVRTMAADRGLETRLKLRLRSYGAAIYINREAVRQIADESRG